MALKLEHPKLTTDDGACWVVKDEVVSVEFAGAPGVLESAVGLNRYAAGDALLTGSTGGRWCVSRHRFDPKYQAAPPISPRAPRTYPNRPRLAPAQRITLALTLQPSPPPDFF